MAIHDAPTSQNIEQLTILRVSSVLGQVSENTLKRLVQSHITPKGLLLLGRAASHELDRRFDLEKGTR
jgi:hypothetical protein